MVTFDPACFVKKNIKKTVLKHPKDGQKKFVFLMDICYSNTRSVL